jgi:hypothetical protein
MSEILWQKLDRILLLGIDFYCFIRNANNFELECIKRLKIENIYIC